LVSHGRGNRDSLLDLPNHPIVDQIGHNSPRASPNGSVGLKEMLRNNQSPLTRKTHCQRRLKRGSAVVCVDYVNCPAGNNFLQSRNRTPIEDPMLRDRNNVYAK
jgi:hypothetical protein